MIHWCNAFGVLAAFALSLLAFSLGGPPPERLQRTAALPGPDATLPYAIAPDGSRALLDRSGRAIPLRDYQRIASGSTLSDALLLEFVSPERIVAFTQYSQNNALYGHRFTGRPAIDALGQLEELLALSPDLLIVSTLSAETRLQRLRDAGLNVFVLGEMRGVESFLANATLLAALLGRAELGALYAQNFRRRLESIAEHLPQAQRRTGLQLTYYGKQIFSSGRDTSYHDVLRYAGLEDLGARRFSGWPSLSLEQVLELDPEIIVTRTGMSEMLCAQDALARLAACRDPQRDIVELPDALINDPGPLMLDSAEWIHRAVYARK